MAGNHEDEQQDVEGSNEGLNVQRLKAGQPLVQDDFVTAARRPKGPRPAGVAEADAAGEQAEGSQE